MSFSLFSFRILCTCLLCVVSFPFPHLFNTHVFLSVSSRLVAVSIVIIKHMYLARIVHVLQYISHDKLRIYSQLRIGFSWLIQSKLLLRTLSTGIASSSLLSPLYSTAILSSWPLHAAKLATPFDVLLNSPHPSTSTPSTSPSTANTSARRSSS